MAAKYLRLVGGRIKEVLGITESAGAADADKLVSTGADGKIDETFIPDSVGGSTRTFVASEALSAGDVVNLFDNAGTINVRKADATATGKEAHGFVKDNVTMGANATVYREGVIPGQAGLTEGRLYLSASTPGAITATAPSTNGNIVQKVAVVISATEAWFEPEVPVELTTGE